MKALLTHKRILLLVEGGIGVILLCDSFENGSFVLNDSFRTIEGQLFVTEAFY